jgi:hypothetical protein
VLGVGDGSFADKPGFVPYAVGLYAVVPIDLDDDGALDIVGIDRDQAEVVVMRKLGPGKLPTFDPYPVGLGPVDLVVADLDNDGALDIATANTIAGTVTVLRADP